MPFKHIESTIADVAADWFLGQAKGSKYGQQLSIAFDKRTDKHLLDNALALGSYLLHTESNIRRRHALRAVLLANFLMKLQPVSIVASLRQKYDRLSIHELRTEFMHLFPAFFDAGNRPQWNPRAFTNLQLCSPFLEPRNWSTRSVLQYTFMVHTLKHPSEVLDSPMKILSGWTAVSMSVLSSRKPTAYSNHGIIVHVPENNILTTSPTDQWFDNYAGTALSRKAPGQSMAKHIAEKSVMIGGLLTPDQVIERQGTPAAMQNFSGAAQTAHNEVVVCGLANQPLPHGLTGPLRLLGVFIQTRMDGTLPERFMKSQGSAKQIELATVACAKNHRVPMLYLPTPDLR